MEAAQSMVFLILILALYFLPTIIGRGKRNHQAIIALNVLFGWTVIGWGVALIWALTLDNTPPPSRKFDNQGGR